MHDDREGMGIRAMIHVQRGPEETLGFCVIERLEARTTIEDFVGFVPGAKEAHRGLQRPGTENQRGNASLKKRMRWI